jgi:antirestriction protein ArdC
MNEYYSTFFHEIIHSTGHEKRLNRSLKNGFGSESYAKEELIAELGSVFLNNHYGIETSNTFDNSTAYIQSWLKALKDDKKLIVTASTQAEKAANYVLEVA